MQHIENDFAAEAASRDDADIGKADDASICRARDAPTAGQTTGPQ